MLLKPNHTNGSRLKIAPVFRRNLRPKKGTPDLMLHLPPELRNNIYELLFLPEPLPKRASWKEPPISQTCKQFRHEALPVHYRRNNFMLRVSLDSGAMNSVVKRIETIVSMCGHKPFGYLHIGVHGSIWHKLEEFLPLLETMRATGFEPASQEYRLAEKTDRIRYVSESSVFLMERCNFGNAQFVLEKALSLGRRARSEEWTAERLARRFKELAKSQRSKRGTDTKVLVELKPL